MVPLHCSAPPPQFLCGLGGTGYSHRHSNTSMARAGETQLKFSEAWHEWS